MAESSPASPSLFLSDADLYSWVGSSRLWLYLSSPRILVKGSRMPDLSASLNLCLLSSLTTALSPVRLPLDLRSTKNSGSGSNLALFHLRRPWVICVRTEFCCEKTKIR